MLLAKWGWNTCTAGWAEILFSVRCRSHASDQGPVFQGGGGEGDRECCSCKRAVFLAILIDSSEKGKSQGCRAGMHTQIRACSASICAHSHMQIRGEGERGGGDTPGTKNGREWKGGERAGPGPGLELHGANWTQHGLKFDTNVHLQLRSLESLR